MNDVVREEKSFIGYEYKDITVKQSIGMIYEDSFPHFGWKLEGTGSSSQGPMYVTLKFKRDRKIPNKVALTRLQRKFESHVRELVRLEKKKVVKASTVAYSIGIAGTAFMAGSVFSYQAGMILLCVLLAIPAFAGWILPYFCFIRIKDKKTEAVSPMIDQQYDAIYEICEEANGLLQ